MHSKMLLARILTLAILLPPLVGLSTMLSPLPFVAAANDSWERTQPTVTKRTQIHTATLLQNGKVLVAGGSDTSGKNVAATELYDPASNRWTPAANLSQPRGGHAAVQLFDGTVLVIGGVGEVSRGGESWLTTAERYSVIYNTWDPISPMSVRRLDPQATLLKDGRVLVTGGFSIPNPTGVYDVAKAEIYDWATNAWSGAGRMSKAQVTDRAVLLKDGDVLVVHSDGTGDRFHPADKSWRPTGRMVTRHNTMEIVRLADGRVLATGGEGQGIGDSIDAAEIYNPTTDKWTAVPPMPIKRAHHTMTLLPSGRVLVAGGYRGAAGNQGTELPIETNLYDPITNSWAAGAPLNDGRATHTATLLATGQVLVVGSQAGRPGQPSSPERYTPASAGNAQSQQQNFTLAQKNALKRQAEADLAKLVIKKSLGTVPKVGGGIKVGLCYLFDSAVEASALTSPAPGTAQAQASGGFGSLAGCVGKAAASTIDKTGTIDKALTIYDSYRVATEWAMADDPPDPNYRIISLPDPPTFPGVTADGEVSPALAAALNGLGINQAQQIGYQRALLHSIERAQGALNEGSAGWATAQSAAAREYAAQLAALLTEEQQLLMQLRQALAADPTSIWLSADDIRIVQQQVAAQGLPVEVASALTDAGVNTSGLSALTSLVISFDPMNGPSISTRQTELSAALGQFNGAHCFEETGHCISQDFLAYWQATGGLAINGYPLTETFAAQLDDGKSYLVQYFERVRMEYHPEQNAPYTVLLGQFGRRIHPADPPVAAIPGTRYFGETGHNVTRPEFIAYWQQHGALPQFGYPLTEEITERLENGQEYRVQYFERARFEWHPENAAPYNVLLGQFGRRILNDGPAASPPPGSAPPSGSWPRLSNVLVTDVSSTSVTIRWTTERLATSEVNYGITMDYGVLVGSLELVTSHVVVVTALQRGQTYHYMITSRDNDGNKATSDDLVFTTLP